VLLPFPLKDHLESSDITTESVILVASITLLISMWRLCRTYGRGMTWSTAVVGIAFYSIGAALDLLDEFYRLPQMIPRIVENTLIAGGISLFSFGVVMIVRQLINLANIDPLTGVYNKHFLLRALSAEVERSKRHGFPLSIMFIDLNKFKKINDQMGHSIGDDVLRKTAEKIKKSVRTTDVIARYGGDEFVLVMPQTDLNSAYKLLNRLTEAISNLEFQGGYSIGISAGITCFPDDGDNVDNLINLADRRMYENKTKAPI